MEITRQQISIKNLIQNYHDDGDSGVFALNDKLIVRPEYQREFVYNDKQRVAVIDSVMHGFPLNVMYYNVRSDGKYEILDGQQRTISICQYVNNDFAYNKHYFNNLTEDEKNKILDYEIDVYICQGSESEKLAWFKVINTAGEQLNEQEILNATYAGPWLSDAKLHFSKPNSAASQLSDGYVKGVAIRQDLLKQALTWISNRDGFKDRALYMAQHQSDKDSDELWQYYQEVIAWAKRLFDDAPKPLRNGQAWGLLYNKYHDNAYNTNDLLGQVRLLQQDEDVQKTSGIIPYCLSEQTVNDQKLLHLRQFTKKQINQKYAEQAGICPICHKHFELNEMDADHIIPWSQGGKTIYDNLQLLCKHDNRVKSDK